jgi:arylsulfatase A-like enzyme
MPKSNNPNILILWGDDIGIWNISHFSRGMMGYQTPNIDRNANEGVARRGAGMVPTCLV